MIRYYDRSKQRHPFSKIISDVAPSHNELLAECSGDSLNPGVILCAKHPDYDSECFYRVKLVTMKLNKPDLPLKLLFLDDKEELHIRREDTRLLKFMPQ